MTQMVQPVSLAPAAALADPPMLRVFISYASEDRDIASAVAEALKAALDDDFAEVNLDKWFMQAGVEFESQIRRKLERTDVLIVIFTGVDKESHGFTGIEVGYFKRVLESRPEGRLVPLFLDSPPASLSALHGLGMGFDRRLLGLDPDAFDAQNEVDPDDPMCRFVGELQQRVDAVRAAIGLRPARLRPEQQGAACVKAMRRTMFRILRQKAEIHFRPQKHVVFATTDAAYFRSRPDLPADARLRPLPDGSPMGIFGLPDVETSWEAFLGAIADNRQRESWRQAIASVIGSSFPDKVNVDNSQIILSADERKSFRIILTACTKYYDDRREFTLCFVETLRRRDLGSADTSLLLNGLDMACRFRFMFLEGASEFSSGNILLTRPEALAEVAHSLAYELDMLVRNAKDAGLDRAGVWSRFVDWPTLLQMGRDYQPQEQALREVIARILTGRPGRDALLALRQELADVVAGLERSMRPANTLLVRAMAGRLQDMVSG